MVPVIGPPVTKSIQPGLPDGRWFLGSPPPAAKSFFFKISDFFEFRSSTSVSSLEQTRAPQNRHGPEPGRQKIGLKHIQ
jgi:hypothetical protein